MSELRRRKIADLEIGKVPGTVWQKTDFHGLGTWTAPDGAFIKIESETEEGGYEITVFDAPGGRGVFDNIGYAKTLKAATRKAEEWMKDNPRGYL